MKRWGLALAAAVSLVLMLGFLMLFVWGFFQANGWAKNSWDPDGLTNRSKVLETGGGRLQLHWSVVHYFQADPAWPANFRRSWSMMTHSPSPRAIWAGGISYNHAGPYTQSADVTPPAGLVLEAWDLSIPYWLLILLTAMLPTWWWLAFRGRRAAARAGLCRNCGYDLRATPSRCPECGLEVEQAPVQRSFPVLGKWAIALASIYVALDLWLYLARPNLGPSPLETRWGWFVANTLWAWAASAVIAAVVALFQRDKIRWPGLVSLGMLILVYAAFPA